MSADSTAYNITHYVVDAVTVSALAIDDCLNDNDIHYCSDKLYEDLRNSEYTSINVRIFECVDIIFYYTAGQLCNIARGRTDHR